MSDGQENNELSTDKENFPVREPLETPETTVVEEPENGVTAVRHQSSNDYFRLMMDRNFLEYASYVIKDRAIPDVDDGLKPVQRRILWALYKVYDGRTHKVANIVGNTMHFHPHGDASIKDALVVLANKEYYILRQGNFGNILTGSPAAAGRYIECSLSQLGYEVLFNNDITEFVDSYDGRNVEPVTLPAKVPSLLMLGSDGIAVGMATKIMPHNFNELLNAEIAVLRGEEFELYPDFQQGGLMDAREYADGNGKITLRAKIEIDGRRLVIREIPATTTTESLVASIEKAAEKNKIKISSVTDYTTEKVEIEVVPTRGYDPEKTLQGLYMYTDCSVSISVNMTVIRENRPVQMTVSEVLYRNVEKLLAFLRQELEIDLGRQQELFHAKTLAQIFFENRIYKRIEECKSQQQEYAEVHAGLAPFREMLRRDVTDEDIDKLLALPVRRISRFDIEKNQRELAEIEEKIAQINRNLAHLKQYAIKYLQNLLAKYGSEFPRRTEIEKFQKIDRREAALNNIKVGWDRKNGYIGTGIKSDDQIACNEFDRFVCVEKSGRYKVIALPPEKLFIGKLYDFRKYDESTEFGIIYREIKSGKYYGKRSAIGGYILDKEYQLCPDNCKLELLTPRADAIYTLAESGARGKQLTRELNLRELPVRNPKARGILVGSKPLLKITHSRYLTQEELEALQANEKPDTEEDVLEDTPDAVDPMTVNLEEPVVEVVEQEPEEPVVEVAEVVEQEPEEPAAEVAEIAELEPEEPAAEVVEVAELEPEEPAAEVVEIVEQEPEEPAAEVAESELESPAPHVTDDTAFALDSSPMAPAHRTRRSPKQERPEKPEKLEKPENPSDSDEFGIIQPEFGF